MRSRSKQNWYIAIEVLYFKPAAKTVKTYTTHVNYLLINAKTPSQAYKNAYSYGKAGDGTPCVDDRGRKSTCIFAGIEALLPVYDDIEDGCEVLWEKLALPLSEIKKRISPKSELLRQARPPRLAKTVDKAKRIRRGGKSHEVD